MNRLIILTMLLRVQSNQVTFGGYFDNFRTNLVRFLVRCKKIGSNYNLVLFISTFPSLAKSIVETAIY